MLAKLLTYSLFGIDAPPVEVEVDISPASMPKTILVGLAEAAVRESTHRVERALVNSGYTRPVDRIVINLSPADLPKDFALVRSAHCPGPARRQRPTRLGILRRLLGRRGTRARWNGPPDQRGSLDGPAGAEG